MMSEYQPEAFENEAEGMEMEGEAEGPESEFWRRRRMRRMRFRRFRPFGRRRLGRRFRRFRFLPPPPPPPMPEPEPDTDDAGAEEDGETYGFQPEAGEQGEAEFRRGARAVRRVFRPVFRRTAWRSPFRFRIARPLFGRRFPIARRVFGSTADDSGLHDESGAACHFWAGFADGRGSEEVRGSPFHRSACRQSPLQRLLR
jgi:hypothetical protein